MPPVLPMQRRLKPLALLGAAALLLHAAALGGLQWTWPQRSELVVPAAAMQVRVVAAPAPRPAAEALADAVAITKPLTELTPVAIAAPVTPVKTVAARPVVAPRARPVLRQPEAPRVMADAVSQAVRPAPDAAGPMPAMLAVAQSMQSTQSAQPAQAIQIAQAPPMARAGTETAAAADEPIPHYRTHMPPAALLRYDLQRGGLHGSGDLLWRPDGDHYELRLDGRVGPLTVLTQVSSGGFDGAGLAPLRFTDKRLRRPVSAAIFQREAGKITFSGPATEFALHAGTQDRLSWMLQLAAIVAAEPALRNAGAKVVMGVVGSHADAAVWTFRCVGREPVETAAGAIDSIRYVRDPRDPYDTTVQVWLDPQHHFLPVHATQKAGPNDEGFSLRLQELAAPP